MHRTALTPFPHLSWLLYGLSVTPPQAFFLHEYTAVAHRLIITEAGDADFGWVEPGSVTARHVSRGDLSFCPADLDRHSLGVTTTAFYGGHVLLVPRSHLEQLCAEEGACQAADLHFIPAFRDPLLFASALRLVFAKTDGRVAENLGAEIAARRLIIRLAAAAGGQLPEWVNDSSVFTPSRMRRIVERVDAHLTGHPTLADMSRGFGLSPSHFARKFRLSTGLSLNRFMNQRRVGQALQLLITTLTPLAQLSLDLGFSSQSHFTHLFRSMTGLTPHQFRLARRCIGGSSHPSRREVRPTEPSGEVPAGDRSATVDPRHDMD